VQACEARQIGDAVGHQVNFFILPADLPAIEEAIQAAGPICLLRDRTPGPEPDRLDNLLPRSRSSPGQLYIARAEDLGSVTTRYVSAQGYWLIESSRSPVIEFSTGIFDGTSLSRGRAYFASDLRFRDQLPSSEWVRWADRVLGRIKRQLGRDPELAPDGIYLSAAARRWAREHEAVLTKGGVAFRAAPAYSE
jgi:hypothetical protein